MREIINLEYITTSVENVKSKTAFETLECMSKAL